MILRPLTLFRVLLGAMLFAICSAPPAFAQPPKQYSIRDFFSNPAQTSFRISPDGKWLAFLQPYEQRMNIHVQRLEARAAPQGPVQRLTNETARDIRNYGWASDSQLLYEKDFGGDENFHVIRIALDGADARDLTPFDNVRAVVVDTLDDDANFALIAHNHRDAEVLDVYRVDIRSGESRLVAENPGSVIGWIVDHAGKVRAATTSDGANQSLLYRQNEQQPFQPIVTTSFKETLAPLMFSPDGRFLYVASDRGRDTQAIRLLDPATGKEGKVLYQHPGYDTKGIGYSAHRKQIEYFETVTWKLERHFVDAVAQKRFAQLEAKLPGLQFSFTSSNRDETKWTVRTSSDRTQGSEYLFDESSNTLTKLVDINPAIAVKDMAKMQPIKYQARDGLSIEGYLTLPVGVEPRNLPVVVNPHGGPWNRDTWGFDPEVQMLANRGYAVLQMNFRGSSGYGRKFTEASYKQWGGRMQDDITDGVNWLIKQGTADPRRVAIYGASYGGYATLSGITKTPDLYAAAIDYVGVSNMFTFIASFPPYYAPLLEKFYAMVGHPEKDKALLEQISPVNHADKIRTPLLVAQGANDPRVKKQESDQMVAALRKRGIEVEYIVKDNEGHGFRNEENRFEFYSAMEKFLARHVPATHAAD